jgi:endonuclease YncB( thermonuclease family)
MPFTLIRGTYHIKGYKPDGDSIRFKALDDANWEKLSGTRVPLNAKGHAQLRLEAIDTLETHYQGKHQPLALGTKALTFLLNSLGIKNPKFDALMTTVTDADEAGTEGFIFSRTTEQGGRPVSFVYHGVPPEADGSSVFVTRERLRESVNVLSAVEGLAYATYYSGLFSDLRAEVTDAVQQARGKGDNIWAEDATNAGFEVPDLTAITDTHVILPKLFRRLVDFLAGGGTVARFKEYLEALQEPIMILSTAHFTHFDTVVEVTGNVVRMTEPPENLVFGVMAPPT